MVMVSWKRAYIWTTQDDAAPCVPATSLKQHTKAKISGIINEFPLAPESIPQSSRRVYDRIWPHRQLNMSYRANSVPQGRKYPCTSLPMEIALLPEQSLLQLDCVDLLQEGE